MPPPHATTPPIPPIYSHTRHCFCSKVIHVPGEGWEKPKALYEVVCKFHVAQGGVTLFEGGERTLALGAFPAEKGKDGKYIRTEQIGEVGFDCDAITAEASAYTGGALIGKALELQIKSMQKGESSEVRCSHAFIGGDCLAAKRMCVHTELVGWSKVEPVPHTNEAVIRKVLNEAPKDSYERPNEDAQVMRIKRDVHTTTVTLHIPELLHHLSTPTLHPPPSTPQTPEAAPITSPVPSLTPLAPPLTPLAPNLTPDPTPRP